MRYGGFAGMVMVRVLGGIAWRMRRFVCHRVWTKITT